ncbi:MAG: PHP domain-containing protein [Candidatus Aminicenantes bacterium]|nr:PHP domain-containing protein [Candidatus Aminicenantes bacterium]
MSRDLAQTLIYEGWQSADLHVHTHHSYDVIPTPQVDPLTLYFKARRLGLAFVAFTDHDTMAAYDQIGWTREGLIPAVEVKILDPRNVGHTIHVNVYTLDRKQFRKIREIAGEARDIVLLTDYLKSENLPFVFNHPFWHEPEETPDLQAVLDVAPLFPVLEYNMGRIGRLNAQAIKLAGVLRKGIVAATDSHVGGIGRAFTLARGKTFKEFFDRIAARDSVYCPDDLNLKRLKEETAVRIRALFDKNVWLYPKASLRMDTGNALLDGIIRRVARDQAGGHGLSRLLMRKAVEAVSGTGIPGSLYIRSQNHLADRIRPLLESAGAPA